MSKSGSTVAEQYAQLTRLIDGGTDIIKQYLSGPLSYEGTIQYAGVVRDLSKNFLEWSGAKLDIRADGDYLHEYPEVFDCPEGLDFDAEGWRPFPDSYSPPEDDDVGISSGEALADLRTMLMLWYLSPTARRRHMKKDRLDGAVLGLMLHPDTGTVDIYEKGGRDLRGLMRDEVLPYISQK